MPSLKQRIVNRFRAAALTAAVGVFVALPAFAQGTGPDLGLGYATAIGLATGDVRTTVSRIISYFLGLLGIVAVCIILYAGFTWMTAGGSEEKITTAKRLIVNAVIGLVIIMSAFAITQFIFRAITGESGGTTSSGGCPPGQVCGGGAGFGGGGLGGFKISGITPGGSGGGKGWPKNYAFQVYFNATLANVNPVPASWVTVTKCNARVDGSGKAQPFDAVACSAVVDGVRTISGNTLTFKPNPNPPGDFSGDFWYVIRVQGGGVKDQNGRTLLCPFTPPGSAGDISSTSAQSDLCDRAAAMSDARDVTAPTVTMDAPKSPPAYCGSVPVQTHAAANDDFLVAGVHFLLDGGTSKLVDVNGAPLANSANASLVNPFAADGVYVDIASLTPGAHKISAIAQDGVPQPGAAAEQNFTVNPPHCCNAAKDATDGETGVDCGGMCGACEGATCTADADCSSGFCNPSSHICEEVPVIDSVSPMAAGTGSLITISGRFFGATAGSVVFLGGAGDADDVVALACITSAWDTTQVVVAVPPKAVSGPLKLVAAYGKSDQTDDARGPNLGNFSVNNQVLPGICYLSPDHGAPGASFDVNGAGFGAAIGTSSVAFGSYAPTVATGGWTDTKVSLIAPPASEKTYPVSVIVNGKTTNKVNYLLQGGSQAGVPKIISVSPESGPIGSYITLQGTGFGRLKGTVKFKFGADIATGEDPVCADNWHDNYVTVKVPKEYLQGAGALQFGALPGVVHKVQIVTAPPAKSSNDDIEFRVTNEPPRPGICAITPDNGRPGKVVQITGVGFGSTAKFGASSAPRYSVDFFKSKTLHCLNNPAATCTTLGATCANPSDGVCAPSTVASNAYSNWSDGQIGTVVAGDYLTKSTWPVTGPVYVVANNQLSSNAVPFTIGDCNEAGASCPLGTSCCANGSCQNSCAPAPRTSAFGWLFSTNVLPELPVVIENSLCRHDPLPEVIQSPSPYKDSTDACKNAEVRVQFSREMQMDNGSLLAAVTMQECGNGATATCGTLVTNLQFTPRDCGNPPTNDHCKVLAFTPPMNYNAGTSFLKQNTWYRVTLKSDAGGGIGLQQSEAGGRFLDGDFDRKAGGDYVFTFRTSASDQTCPLANVYVEAPSTTIDQDTHPVQFQSLPTGVNCNSLQCAPSLYTLKWAADSLYLDLSKAGPPVPPNANSNFCTKPVSAKAEVPHTPLTATMTTIGTAASKLGESDVTVKFAEPHVVEVTPIAGCKEACINSAITAMFNVPMDPASLAQPGNVELLRCRNASCTAPFLPLDGTVRSVDAEPPDQTLANGTKVYKHVTLRGMAPAAYLKPGTFYIVRIKGGVTGVKSRSGVPLVGLNDGMFYRWQFRTKDDATACLASRAAIDPTAATLYFIGEKRDLRVKAFGSPDSCNKAGQELMADGYSWTWSFLDPNRILGGFVDGSPITPIAPMPPQTVVNTNSLSKPQCTAQCLLRGSQSAVPQCGDGVVDVKFEQCDPSGMNCSANCLFTGTTGPTCGNGIVDTGETCDKSLRCVGGANIDKSCATVADCPGGSCDSVFSKGCKDPATHVDGFADGFGCIDTGSLTAKNSVCGDGFVSDGEACDDRNTANGDGCSADCLKEGTLKTCLGAAPGESCINFCGNGVVEPGEEPDCEKGPSPSANGCNSSTCLKNGLPKCTSTAGTMCCGNSKAETGEDAACETDPERTQFCTERCTLKGSSGFYTSPSFCGDGITGKGERAECEQSPDTNTDPYQVTVTEPQNGFDATSLAGSSTTVTATTTGIDASSVGKAKLSLSCTCKSKPAGSQDAFCAQYGADLACATNGCCASRPKVLPPVLPPDMKNDDCRNAAIRVGFDQLMDVSSLEKNIIVGYDNGMNPCPTDAPKVPLAYEPRTGGVIRNFFSMVWDAVGSFVREFIIRPVFGAAAGMPDATHNYCAVKAALVPVNVGEPATVTVVNVNIERALPPNTWIVLRVLPEVKSVSGVNLGGNGFTSHFGTSKDICTVSHVFVTPASMLFSSVNQPAESAMAHAYASTDEEIVPTVEYSWTWDWTPQSTLSPVVLDPVMMGAKQTAIANVRVRGSRSDLDGGAVPKNGEAVIEAAAVVAPFTCRGGSNSGKTCTADTDCAGGGLCQGVRYSGEGQVTVMLCENPWPSHQVCAVSPFTLPWDATPSPNTCTLGARFWYPFYDAKTNFKFYYCRDGKAEGDATPALPALRETPVVITPGRDILKEYLFTYDTVAFPANGASWAKDALGLRVSYNSEHLGVARWYKSKGFNGTPTPMKVDGYDAVKDDRTIYVNAAAMTPAMGKFNLYTNINTLSYTDNAAPETVNVFNQITKNIDFNRNNELQDQSICRDAPNGNVVRCNIDLDCRVNSSGTPVATMGGYTCDAVKGLCRDKDKKIAPNAGIALGCSTDLDCQQESGEVIKDAAGKPARIGFVCDDPKQKLVRDVKRWSDLQNMREYLLEQRSGKALPKLDAGTFLVTMTNSTWPSWSSKLASPGAALPSDPVNKLGWCADVTVNRDGATCWSDKTRDFVCPVQSHTYQYEFFQETEGVNFRLRTDFENGSDATKTWAGLTCPELSETDCMGRPNECVWDGSACNFVVGKMWIGGVNPLTPQCTGTSLSSGGICGDGMVNLAAGEVCEPGQERAVACSEMGRDGSRAQICRSDCKDWEDKPKAVCETGKCGDGVIQPPEICDEGPLNGKYGHCGATCNGKGFSCGDGKRQPGEVCDCKELNGQYSFNGVVAPDPDYTMMSCGTPDDSTPSCSWDCSGAGPRCGDGVVNGGETCDGGFQEFKGYCDDMKQKGCNTNADCPTGNTCGNFCPKPEQKQHRACQSNDPADPTDNTSACTWGSWVCTAPGFCGNGKVEVGEQCDDGNTNNTDGCVIDPAKGIMCKKATCGDSYVNPALGEQCDEGANNNRVCTPKYGLSCTYCQSSCKLATVSGGYCGDNILQTPGSTPVGPEECEGSQGLSSDWVCVSTRPEDQSYGKNTGDAICSKKNCARSCAAPDSRVCQIPPAETMVAALPGGGGGGGGGMMLGGGGVMPMSAAKIESDAGIAGSVCDPDKDNDGVPASLDCDDNDKDVHPAYHLDYRDEKNVAKSIDIPAAKMICNHKDNACNGLVDSVINFQGKVINAKNKKPLKNAEFQMWCAGKVIASVKSDVKGEYALSAQYDPTCAGVYTITGVNSPEVCADGDPDSIVHVKVGPGDTCKTITVPDLILVPRPGGPLNPGIAASMFITWPPTRDMDFYVRDQIRTPVGYEYGDTGDSNGAPSPRMDEIVFDVDDRDGRGPETISLRYLADGRAYRFYAKNYDLDQSWDMVTILKSKLFDQTCSQTTTTYIGPYDNSKDYWGIFDAIVSRGKLTPQYTMAKNPGGMMLPAIPQFNFLLDHEPNAIGAGGDMW